MVKNNFDYYKEKVCSLCTKNSECTKEHFHGYKNMKGDITVRCPYYSFKNNKEANK